MLKKVLHKHALLKSRIIRGNQTPFMNKELSKAVMRSQLKTKSNKTKQGLDLIGMHIKSKEICVKLRRKAVKQYFVKRCQSGLMSNKTSRKQ